MQTRIISFQGDILPLKNVLYRLALRITLSHEDAEDVVQDTMMKLWSKREQWPAIENIEAFATTICRNLALDKTRRKAPKSPPAAPEGASLVLGAESVVASSGAERGTWGTLRALEPSPYEQTAQRDRIEVVKRMVDSLPEKQRSCMQLRDFEGKSYKEIAIILDISEEQVKVNIFRARQTIKKKFQEAEEYGL